MTAADFPLPTLGPLLAAILRDVTSGRGFALLKGLPVQRWSRLQVQGGRGGGRAAGEGLGFVEGVGAGWEFVRRKGGCG